MDAVTCTCPQIVDGAKECGAKFYWFVKDIGTAYYSPLQFVPCWKCKNVNMVKLDKEGGILVQATDGNVKPKLKDI